MASHALQAVQAAPLDVLLSAIPSLPRAVLSRLTDRLIEQMDRIDGDNDRELNGDELDGDNGAEDAFGILRPNVGIWVVAGCPISDPDCCVDDRGELTDEREPELYDGGQRDPPLPYRFHITA